MQDLAALAKNLLKNCFEVGPRAQKPIRRGLKRLRKKAFVRGEIAKSIPQGLKPALILLAFCRG
jgi:hypothetical protein